MGSVRESELAELLGHTDIILYIILLYYYINVDKQNKQNNIIAPGTADRSGEII